MRHSLTGNVRSPRAMKPFSARNHLLAVIGSLVFIGLPTRAAPDRAHVVNVYAWSDYFPQSVVEKFQSETGMHVNYTVFDSPDTAETALSVGSSNYDIVTMNASPHLAREIPRGFWKKLDQSQIPNARNADPQILKMLSHADPGNLYAVPWMWGTVGVVYNADKVKSIVGALPAESLDLIFKRELAAKFEKCGISVLDSWQDILPLVARYLGQPELSAEPAQLQAVEKKLEEIRPFLRRIATSGYYEQLADGELCVAIGYSGDAMIARRMAAESGTKIQVNYAFPRVSVPLYIDSMVIPADSPNYAGALKFIDFMMRPEISAEVTRFIGFASGNAAALRYLDPPTRANSIVYPPAEVRARFAMERVYTTDELRTFNRTWQRFRTGQ
ncbi:MAG TPA: extracellular solute-binding protein [Steroidobacteraceae bacterium]|nr:extracellular solute-binding protein [Steroidobacteraceae bacterium]